MFSDLLSLLSSLIGEVHSVTPETTTQATLHSEDHSPMNHPPALGTDTLQ